MAFRLLGNLQDLAREARELDEADPLRHLRNRFAIPPFEDGRTATYLCGHSLGPMPLAAAAEVSTELDRWAELAVDAHFDGARAWVSFEQEIRNQMAGLVGARASEVVAMNGLTVNLHLFLLSFYQRRGAKDQIVLEGDPFPSDLYAVTSQIRMHGLRPEAALRMLPRREGEFVHRTDDILAYINEHGSSISLLLLGGVHFVSGQVLPIRDITHAAHAKGIVVGFDLAHAVGNVPLELHDWDVDFAVWCTYKYLNGGPGSVAGGFVHERWADVPNMPRAEGWWGHDPATRFDFEARFCPDAGAGAWQVSNPPILSMAPLRSSLTLFREAGGMEPIRAKSMALSSLLAACLDRNPDVSVITPVDPEQRAAQVAIRLPVRADVAVRALAAQGIVCDSRPPNILRVSLAPLYNSFQDAVRLADALIGFLK